MPIDLDHLQERAGLAFQNILAVLPTVSGAQREALLAAMNALDDIEALADAASEDVPDDAEGLRTLAERAAGRAEPSESLGENVEHLALWRSRPMPDMPALAEGQRLRAAAPASIRPRFDGADGKLPALRLGA